MLPCPMPRRRFLACAASTTLAACAAPAWSAGAAAAAEPAGRGSQRLSLEQLHKWESLRYGMFIHFGMSTFVGDEFADGKRPPRPTLPIGWTSTNGFAWPAMRA